MSIFQPSTQFKSHQWNGIYLLSAISTLIGALAVSVQPLLLDQIFNIPFEKEGEINADIQVVAEMVSILCVGYFSFKSDKVGRVPIIFFAFLFISIGAFLTPLSYELGVYLGVGGLFAFYFARVLVTLGSDTVQIQLLTLVGDLSDFKNRPQLMTNTVFMIVFGGTILTAIVMQIAEYEYGIELITFSLVLFGGFGAWVTRYALHDVADFVEEDKRHPLLRVWDLVSGDPRMQLAVAAAFYTRMDLVVVSLFYSLWCISIADIIGVSRIYATAHAATMVGIMGMGVLCSIPFWQHLIERHSRITTIGASLSISAVGYVWLSLFSNPYDWGMALPLILIGIGHGGATVTLKVLTVDIAPKALLGSVLGMIYLAGSIGIIMLVQSGGYYFDAVGPRAPFVLMASGKLMVVIFASWLVMNQVEEDSNHVLKKKVKISWRPLIFLTAGLPFAWLLGRMLLGGYLWGVDHENIPVGFINRYLGDWAFTFLIVSLAITPFAELTKIKAVHKYRRMIGLYAFFYTMLHFIVYVSLEWTFDLDHMLADAYKRPFIFLGLVSFFIIAPLAITSFKSIREKMDPKVWRRLHKSAYVLNIIVAWHFILAANEENGEPYIYAALVAILLGYRVYESIQKQKRRANRKPRRRRTKRKKKDKTAPDAPTEVISEAASE
ncbi:Magnetosome protein MamZ, major facilitator superfamily [Candidatus Terasakiella magnetica]|uniref:Protein-methionine-sulfoxide reductase heme-binding subunit MsrQ n=1 Tax=Candidatus Terasakiella magnetica TaxID=1867952 RepID=A0A1C3RH55_9PROT|nr:magnetosome biogenesis transporter MamZ [Candidatus Terasakiella magnetica]SCA56599.1 Magnetosome protein MamZ, major facilitator superfamily [Candidatus Terasakiella magnetica]